MTLMPHTIDILIHLGLWETVEFYNADSYVDLFIYRWDDEIIMNYYSYKEDSSRSEYWLRVLK